MSKARERQKFQNRLIHDVTEDLLVAMEDAEISKSKLAELLGKSRARVSSMLNGSSNMTLKTLASICYETGLNLEIKIGNGTPVRAPNEEQHPMAKDKVEYDLIEWDEAVRPAKKQGHLTLIDCPDSKPVFNDESNASFYGEFAEA